MEKFAVLGCGVVGSGVVELFEKNKALIEKRCGKSLEMAYILDLRDFPDRPYGNKVVKDINVILNDPDVKVVAECMGGLEPAFTFVKSCLEAGKSVATSNKELVAAKGDILLKTAKEHDCNFFFEASVGGAIPIIRPLHKCLAANDFSAIAGILNGTTNFILNKMIKENMDFSTALALAQEKGYAEKDPTADVEGHDACRKICILSSLAFGKHVYPESVHTKGIREVELKDVELCNQLGYTIKLIARVQRLENGKILPTVMPMAVEEDNLLSQVNGVYNAVMVRGDGISKAMFYGRGAGKFPTASAVLGDMIEEVQLEHTIPSQTWENVNSTDFIEDF
ncbi:MAG TPA: homoserine dehydrogenase, partial [Ruminococcus sp.]|nr:homoserine dehydrogenase [Ruminococcus sp.]